MRLHLLNDFVAFDDLDGAGESRESDRSVLHQGKVTDTFSRPPGCIFFARRLPVYADLQYSRFRRFPRPELGIWGTAVSLRVGFLRPQCTFGRTRELKLLAPLTCLRK